MTKDYYKVLGIAKDASPDEIKRAYRKLAHLYHPDKNQDHANGEKFKEINEAYQVLSNPEKKAQYDQFGSVGDASGFRQDPNEGFDFRNYGGGFSSGGFGNLGDIFEDFFGGVFSQVQTEVDINLTSAILGDTLMLQTSNGEQITFNVPAGTQDGQSFRFRGKGMPTKRGRGDLIVTVKVKIPRRFSREQKELLEQLKNLGL